MAENLRCQTSTPADPATANDEENVAARAWSILEMRANTMGLFRTPPASVAEMVDALDTTAEPRQSLVIQEHVNMVLSRSTNALHLVLVQLARQLRADYNNLRRAHFAKDIYFINVTRAVLGLLEVASVLDRVRERGTNAHALFISLANAARSLVQFKHGFVNHEQVDEVLGTQLLTQPLRRAAPLDEFIDNAIAMHRRRFGEDPEETRPINVATHAALERDDDDDNGAATWAKVDGRLAELAVLSLNAAIVASRLRNSAESTIMDESIDALIDSGRDDRFRQALDELLVTNLPGHYLAAAVKDKDNSSHLLHVARILLNALGVAHELREISHTSAADKLFESVMHALASVVAYRRRLISNGALRAHFEPEFIDADDQRASDVMRRNIEEATAS